MSVPVNDGARYFDLYRGIELDGNNAFLSFPLEAHGLAPFSKSMAILIRMRES